MGHFESRAAASYAESSKDVAQLLAFHEQIGGTGPGRRWYVSVLNRSAIVLLCAVWEAYCEDLADEALRHIVNSTSDPSKLPQALRKQVAKELRESPHELSPWQLASDSWKTHLLTRLSDFTRRRNFDWNNPRAANVQSLFERAGIPNITDAWSWQRTSGRKASDRLDRLVALRGDIAHRGDPPIGSRPRRGLRGADVEKVTVLRAVYLVNTLVEKTDAKVARELKRMTGVDPWAG